jgi:hypothetical protein
MNSNLTPITTSTGSSTFSRGPDASSENYNKLFARLRHSPEVAKKLDEALLELYGVELEEDIKWKTRWKKIGNTCIATSKFVVSLAIVFDFLSGVYGKFELSVVAGVINTLTLSVLAYSSFAYSQSKNRSQSLIGLAGVSKVTVTNQEGTAPAEEIKNYQLCDRFPTADDTQDGFTTLHVREETTLNGPTLDGGTGRRWQTDGSSGVDFDV